MAKNESKSYTFGDMPIEIKESSPDLEEPQVYRLEDLEDKVFIGIGKKGVTTRLSTEPKLGRDIGIIEFDTKDLKVTRNDGVVMINAPFYTKPGDEITVEKKNDPRRLVIKHLPASQ